MDSLTQKKTEIRIQYLTQNDKVEWDVLVRDYKAFYQTTTSDNEYDLAWAYLMGDEDIFGLSAKIDGRLVGFAHFLFHRTLWTQRSCYLQDLFTVPTARRCGVAQALIHVIAQHARSKRYNRLYWQTQAENTTARALYDKVAEHRGFIRYDYPL
ncbi:MAG: GNAT family N-acetyltransferase [Arenicella sp.]